MRRETQAHTAKRGHPLILIIHAGQLDFVSDAPRQTRGFVAQRSMPSQGRMQINSTGIDEIQDVNVRQRLFGNPCANQAEECPGKNGSCGS